MSISAAFGSGQPVSARSLNAASDEALARRVGTGDEPAFEEIYRRYADRLFRYCSSLLGSREEAEEAVQSALFSAYRALRQPGRDVQQLRPWLYRIAHNGALDILRRRRQTEQLTGFEESLADRPDEEAGRREDLAQLRRDLAALEPLPRSALVLREMGGLSHAEIAVALDATPNGAKQLISEARASLHAFEDGRGLACAEVRGRISDFDGRVLRGRTIRSHLRHCEGCESYRAAIALRRKRLPLLFPPLTAPAAQAMLEAILGTGGSAGAGALVSAGVGGGGLALKAALIGVLALGGAAAVLAPLGVYGDRGPSSPSTTAPGPSVRASAVPAAVGAPAASRRGVAPAARTRTAPAPSGPGGGASTPALGSTDAGAAGATDQASGGTAPGDATSAGAPPASAKGGGTSVAASADVPKGRVSAGVKAGPVSAGASVDAPAGKASVKAAAGPVTAGVSADASRGAAAGGAQAGPASAGVGVGASSGSAGATVSTPAASATVTAGAGGGGATVSTPVATVTVPLPPLPLPPLPPPPTGR